MLSAAADASRSSDRDSPDARAVEYRLLRLLGRGGMGDVWLAERCAGGARRRVALKRISPDLVHDPMVRRMFLDEARLSRRLRHPNVARALDSGEVDGRPFIAFELVEGVDLRTLWRARGRSLPIGFALHLARELCAALGHVHRLTDGRGRWLGVVHRDVSPSNVMLGWDGAVKLIDFGVAKTLGDPAAEATRVGVVKGKVGYLAPELLDGIGCDQRADLFSLGVLLYELLAGERLFVGVDEKQAIARNRACRVRPPSARNPRVTPELDEITLRLLARDPRARYAGADELAGALARVQPGWPWTREETARLLGAHRQAVQAAGEATDVVSIQSAMPTQAWEPDEDWLTAGLAALVLDGGGTTLAPRAPAGPRARWSALVSLVERRRTALWVGAGIASVALALLLAFAPAGPRSGAPEVRAAVVRPPPVVTAYAPERPSRAEPIVVPIPRPQVASRRHAGSPALARRRGRARRARPDTGETRHPPVIDSRHLIDPLAVGSPR